MRIKLLLFAVVFSSVSDGLKAQVDVEDSLALVDLYNSTGGAGWTNHTNWLTSKPVSKWYGVYVANKKVYNLSLRYNNLRGVLPQTISNVSGLETLDLGYNQIEGAVPSTLGTLKKLITLNLDRNSFSGEIPSSLGDLPLVRNISFYQNKLSGQIPAALGNCTQLDFLALSNNQLTGGIPQSFKRLTLLGALGLGHNKLSGPLEDVFPEENLEFQLDLSYNHFSGSIPPFIGNFKKLIFMSLDHNDFSGHIPEELCNLTRLEELGLSYNQLTGGVPSQLQDLPYLTSLVVNNNELTADKNPQYNGRKITNVAILLAKNKFTFNGLEYLEEKYFSGIYASRQANIPIHVYQNKLAVSAGGTLSKNTYKWFKVGQPQSVTIMGDSTFQPTHSGSYYARITNSVVIGLTLKTDTFSYVMPVVKNELIISISPNPARGMISIYGLNEKSDAKVTIADMIGYVWMSAMSRKKTSLQINVSWLKAGNYLVTVNDGKLVKTVMFVKE